MLDLGGHLQGVVYRLEGAVVDPTTGELMPHADESLRLHSRRDAKTGLVSSEFVRSCDITSRHGLPTPDAFASRLDLRTEEIEHELSDLYMEVLGRLELDGSEVVVVETRIAGVKAARNAGCIVLGMASPEHQPILTAVGARAVVGNHNQADYLIAHALAV